MIKAIVWVALVITFFANFFSYRSMFNLNKLSAKIDRSQYLLDRLDSINFNLALAELAEHDFLIFKDPYYSKSFLTHLDKVKKDFRTFQETLKEENDGKNNNLSELQALITGKEQFFLETSRLSRLNFQDLEKLLGNSTQGLGKIHFLLDKIENDQEKLLDIREKEEQDTRSRALVETSLGDIISLSLLLFALYHLNRENKIRRRIEFNLRESEERFRSSFDHAAVGVGIINLNGQWVKVNMALCKMLGYDEKELITVPLNELTHPDDLDRDQQLRDEMLKGKINSYHIEKRVLTRNEEVLFVLISFSVVNNYDNTPLYFIVQFQDITQRKQAEEELEYKNQELIRSNASLIEFAYVVSHDLQEPLRSINENLRQLKGDNHSNGNLLDSTLEVTERMKLLISDLLTYSMAGINGKIFLTDSNKIASQVLKNLEGLINLNHARVTTDQLPSVEVDPVRLEQLFQNLLSNALKYRKKDIPPEIHIGVIYKEKQIIFFVSDNGIGIPEEHQERIFNIFTRLHSKKEYSGTGIGLAICKKIVEHYGGKIWLTSSPGAGTTFYFTIPGKVNYEKAANY